jgi:hypothetical protein
MIIKIKTKQPIVLGPIVLGPIVIQVPIYYNYFDFELIYRTITNVRYDIIKVFLLSSIPLYKPLYIITILILN